VHQKADAGVDEVLLRAGGEVVDREHRRGSLGEAALTEVRADEAGASEDDDVFAFHRCGHGQAL
jgi:hypothetical protein